MKANVIKNIIYSNLNQKSLLLDLYLPKTINAKIPVILYLHGGAWKIGSKDDSKEVSTVYKRLVDNGYAVAVINYYLSGEAIFPAQIIDCKSAVRYLRASADKYNLDSSKIGVWGRSAGAHLANLLGTTGNTSCQSAGLYSYENKGGKHYL
jgi:acetyl esterase/lipase